MSLNRNKLKELILLICRECRDPEKLGAVKLQKILWYSDGRSFTMTGEPITGETYIKGQFGPVSPHVNALVRELEAEGKLTVRDVEYKGYPKKEYIARADADKSLFSEGELNLIKENIRNICEDHTASSISERSHNFVWEAAAMNEPIPYEALWAARGAGWVPEDIMEWAKEQYANK